MNNTKKSKQYEAILSYLKSVRTHPTADMVYSEVKKSIPNISLGTVYRNLSRLVEEGEVVRVTTGMGAEHFDGAEQLHSHIICTGCGGIADIDSVASKEMLDWAEDNYKGKVYDHSITFFGMCDECKNKN